MAQGIFLPGGGPPIFLGHLQVGAIGSIVGGHVIERALRHGQKGLTASIRVLVAAYNRTRGEAMGIQIFLRVSSLPAPPRGFPLPVPGEGMEHPIELVIILEIILLKFL